MKGLDKILPEAHDVSNPEPTRNSTYHGAQTRSVSVKDDESRLRQPITTGGARFNDTEDKFFQCQTPLKPKSWTDPKLLYLPKYYPLERTTAKIKSDKFNVKTFMKTMASMFRAMSVQVDYNDEPASMSLLTPEFVEIHVALWFSCSGEQVLVEVQRCRGDSITFHNYAQCILNAALGKEDFSTHYYVPNVVDELNLEYLLEAENLVQSLDKEGAQNRKEIGTSSLEVLHSLFSSGRDESLVSGMEGLCILTDARKTGAATATMFARVILSEDAASLKDKQIVYHIQNMWLSALEKNLVAVEREPSPIQEECGDNEEESLADEYERDTMETSDFLFNKALTVLLNVLELSLAIGKLKHCPANLAAISVSNATKISDNKKLVSTLVHDIGNAEEKPHGAFLCSKCLTLLYTVFGSQVLEGNLRANAVATAKRGYHYGRLYHAKLEKGCHELLQVLG